jgi:hypothetical protein
MRSITTLSLLSFLALLIGQIHAICIPGDPNCGPPKTFVGREISLEASEYTNYYLRHKNVNQVWVDSYNPLPDTELLSNLGLIGPGVAQSNTCFQTMAAMCSTGNASNLNEAVSVNDASYTVVSGLCGITGTVSFQSVNFPTNYLRQQNLMLYLMPPSTGDTTYNNDACFYQRTSLLQPVPVNGSSFESVSNPGYFIRNSNFRVIISPTTDPAPFTADATWIVQDSLRNQGLQLMVPNGTTSFNHAHN